MHIQSDERDEDLSLKLCEVRPDELREHGQVLDVLLKEGVQGAHGVVIVGRQAGFQLPAPVDAVARKHELGGLSQDPLLPVARGIIVVALLAHSLERVLHEGLHVREPLLDVSPCPEVFSQAHVLALARLHAEDIRALWVLAKVKALDPVKALGHVRLHGLNILGLGQDFQELVVGQEVEPREAHSLGLQVILQILLHLLESLVTLLEELQPPWGASRLQGVASVLGPPHDVLELLINSKEGLGLVRKLPLNIRRAEDALKVHPLLLALEPLVKSVREQAQLVVQLVHLGPDTRHESTGENDAHGDHAVLQRRDDLVHSTENEGVLELLEGQDSELNVGPLVVDLLEHALEGGLLGGLRADSRDVILEVLNIVAHEEPESELVVPHQLLVHHLLDLVPVPLLHVLVPQVLYNGQGVLELVHLVL